MCKQIPLAMATDCRSLYDVCSKAGSLPDEKRVALDLMDLRDSLSDMGDVIRWVPTDHMLADVLTKDMNADALLAYLKNMQYSLKYDEQISSTKRSLQKQRAQKRKKGCSE